MNSNPSICSLFGQQCVKYVPPVDAIVKRTGKVEVIGDERFERRTILADVCLITGAHDGNVSFVMSETRPDGNKIGDSLDTHEATNDLLGVQLLVLPLDLPSARHPPPRPRAFDLAPH